ARIVRGLYDERASIEFLSTRFERFFGSSNLQILQLEAKTHQRIFRVVIDQKRDGLGRRRNTPSDFRITRKQSHRRLQDALIDNSHSLDVPKRAKSPTGIVVWPRSVPVVGLRGGQ